MRGASIAAGIISMAVALLACSTDPDPGSVNVLAVDDEFSAPLIRVPVGATVQWIMHGRNVHNVSASDDAWQSELVLETGDRFSRTFDQPGTFPYFCTFHGTAEGQGMAGYVLVGDQAELPARIAGPDPVDSPTGLVRHVPGDFTSIQEAVDAAQPGDLVLVQPGVYRESVVVTTPSLTIRGVERNSTVLDGSPHRDRETELINGIQVVAADGVAIENLTAHNFALNGFYWTGVEGYRASYLTAYNNGEYGIYAFDSTDGVFEHSYASGHPDSGFYIGQCFPCRAVIRDVVAENNALGYSGTNAGGDLYIVDSVWRGNRAGIVPNTLDSELNPPHRSTTIVGNLVVDNNSDTAPTNDFGLLGQGNGIALVAGIGDVVERNLVLNHDRLGIVATSFVDQKVYFSYDAAVRDNVVAGSGWADLGLVGPWGTGNCFSDNLVTRTFPPLLQELHGCTGIRLPLQADLAGVMLLAGIMAEASNTSEPLPDWRTAPAPAAQPNMPNPATDPARPAAAVFGKPDLAAVGVPAPPAGIELRNKEVLMAGIPISPPSFWQTLFGLFGYFLPIALFAAWVGLAMWDLARRSKPIPFKLAWLAVILLVPFVGVLAYLLAGRSHLPRWFRFAITGGAIFAYLLVLVIGALLGGIV